MGPVSSDVRVNRGGEVQVFPTFDIGMAIVDGSYTRTTRRVEAVRKGDSLKQNTMCRTTAHSLG